MSEPRILGLGDQLRLRAFLASNADARAWLGLDREDAQAFADGHCVSEGARTLLLEGLERWEEGCGAC